MMKQTDSKVEVKGLEAFFYDSLMNVVTAGTYPFFIKKVIQSMNIQSNDKILELGSGTARNICLMKQYTKNQIVGLDIGKIMLKKSRRKCKKFHSITIQKQSILAPIPFENEFDKILISFVFHGFTQKNRLTILSNAYKALKPNGIFYILDYNEMNLEEKSFLIRFFFKKIECPLAEDYLTYHWKSILSEHNLFAFQETFFYKNTVRLLSAKKRIL